MKETVEVTLDGVKSTYGVAAFEAGDDGKAVTTLLPVAIAAPARAPRKASTSSFKYFVGSYTVSGNVYKVEGFGEVTIEGSGTSVTLKVKPLSGSEITLNGTKQSMLSSDTYTDNLCRTWQVTKTVLRYKTGGVTVGKNFNGCDLHEIVEFAKKYANIDDNTTVNEKITAIEFTRAGTIFITHANGKTNVGTWRWSNKSNGELVYSWNDPSMGNALESGSVGAAVSFISNTSCELTLGADVQSNEGTYRITMTETLVD